MGKQAEKAWEEMPAIVRRTVDKASFILGYEWHLEVDSKETEMLEMLKEMVSAEWMMSHDWGGDREGLLKKADALITKIEG